MNYLIQDTYNHKGEHISIEKDCLCNYETSTICLDYEREILYCSDCGATKKFPKYYTQMFNVDIIESWLLKPRL